MVFRMNYTILFKDLLSYLEIHSFSHISILNLCSNCNLVSSSRSIFVWVTRCVSGNLFSYFILDKHLSYTNISLNKVKFVMFSILDHLVLSYLKYKNSKPALSLKHYWVVTVPKTLSGECRRLFVKPNKLFWASYFP